jgi:uncharacterized membrane protein YeaQ/YmgE (transglycosylase-associated protein family)
MSLLVILLVGAVIGWLASIVLLTEHLRGIFAEVAIGMGGAFVCGGLASGPTMLTGLTPEVLIAAALGALALLALVHISGIERLPERDTAPERR